MNKIDLILTSDLTLTLSPNTNPIPNPKPDRNPNLERSRKKREKQLRNIIVSLLRYVILLKSGCPIWTGARGPFHRTFWIRPTSTLVVNIEPLLYWPGSMCIQPRPLESNFRSILFLWRISTHCHIFWTIIPIWNFSVGYQPYICLMRRLLPGSACWAPAKKNIYCLLYVLRSLTMLP